jgi:hypothetical protein
MSIIIPPDPMIIPAFISDSRSTAISSTESGMQPSDRHLFEIAGKEGFVLASTIALIDLSRFVSTPHINAPAPRTISISKEKSARKIFSPRKPYSCD